MKPNHVPCPKCNRSMHRQSRSCRECLRKPTSYIQNKCEKCGNGFTVHKSQVLLGHGKYCSKSCARSGSPTRKKDQVLLQCEVCDHVFLRYPSEVKKSVIEKSFCSKECWYTWNVAENNVNYQGGQNERMNPQYTKWRKAVLRRDGYRCRRCHEEEDLQAHHIKRFATHPDVRWEVSNGITLCKSCHKLFRGVEEEYEHILELIAATKHCYCETLDDFYKALSECGPNASDE